MAIFKRRNGRRQNIVIEPSNKKVIFVPCKPEQQRCMCAFSLYEYFRGEDIGFQDFLTDFAVQFLSGYQVVSCITPAPAPKGVSSCILLSQGLDAAFLRHVWSQQLLVDHALEIYAFQKYPNAESYSELQTVLQKNQFSVLIQLYTEHDELVIQCDPEKIPIKGILEKVRSICSIHNKILVTEVAPL